MHRVWLVIAAAGTTAYAQPIAPPNPQASPVVSPSTDVPTIETRGATMPPPAPATPARPRTTVAAPAPSSSVVQPPSSATLPKGQREDEVEDALAVVWFATDSDEVPSARREALGRAVRWLNTHPDRLLYIEGHADRRGGPTYNLHLSENRAIAVREELIRLGADRNRIVVASYGESEPLASLAESRRVVVSGSPHAFPELTGSQVGERVIPSRQQPAFPQARRPNAGRAASRGS